MGRPPRRRSGRLAPLLTCPFSMGGVTADCGPVDRGGLDLMGISVFRLSFCFFVGVGDEE